MPFSFYRGTWGSDACAIPIPASEEQAICDLIIRGGHHIMFSGTYIGIFTPVGYQIESLILNARIHGMPGTLFGHEQPDVDDLVKISAAISYIDALYKGMEYIIYMRGAVNRIAFNRFYNSENTSNMVRVILGYTRPVYVLRRTGFASEVIMITQSELRQKVTDGIVMTTLYNNTWISCEVGDKAAKYELPNCISCSKRPSHMKNLHNELNKLANSDKTLYIYSGNSYRGMLPHIHEPHLEMLRGILLSDAQVDMYASSKYVSADDHDVIYDD